jgi:hypothetical protein
MYVRLCIVRLHPVCTTNSYTNSPAPLPARDTLRGVRCSAGGSCPPGAERPESGCHCPSTYQQYLAPILQLRHDCPLEQRLLARSMTAEVKMWHRPVNQWNTYQILYWRCDVLVPIYPSCSIGPLQVQTLQHRVQPPRKAGCRCQRSEFSHAIQDEIKPFCLGPGLVWQQHVVNLESMRAPNKLQLP